MARDRSLSDRLAVFRTTRTARCGIYKSVAASVLLVYALTFSGVHMNSSSIQPTGVKTPDPDLAKQAVSGHGVPSQDPDAEAQVALSPEEAERESKSVLIGGGLVAGSAAGAAIGAVVAGPVGVLVGGTIGAVAGAIGGGGAGGLIKPESTTRADNASEDTDKIHRGTPLG